MRSISFLLLIVIAFSLTFTQGSASAIPQSRMVMLNVRVTDSLGRAVVGVSQSSLVVTEDGVPQKIELFHGDETPLSYGLVIDSSGSVGSQFEQLLQAAAKVIQANKPTDETFIIRFISSDKVEIAQEPTSDKAQLLKVISEFYFEGGQSAVVDAVYLSAQKLAQQKADPVSPRRRVLVLITDGEDRESYYKHEHLFNLLAATDIQIFTIGLTKELTYPRRDKAINLLTRLGAATGGQTFFASSAEELERIASQLMNEIRTQYVMGYVPAGIDASKGFHKIHVSIADNPNQEKRVAVTRVGYSSQS